MRTSFRRYLPLFENLASLGFGRSSRRALRKSARRRAKPGLQVERLEDRSLLATLAWTGLGSNDNWNKADNWNPAQIPINGDSVTFPTGPAVLTSHNNLSNLTLNTITFNGSGYTVTGNAITLNGGISDTAAGTNDIHDLPITLGGNQTWTIATGATLNAGTNVGTHPINLDGHQLIIDGGGTTFLGEFDDVNPAATNGVTMEGTGTLILAHSIPIAMTATLTNGTLQVNEADPNMLVNMSAGTLTTDLGTGGETGAITSTGGTIAPGGVGTTGILSVNGSSTLSTNTTYSVDLNGTTPGTGYDQMNLTAGNSINLGNALLTVAESTPSSLNDVFTIVSAPGGFNNTKFGNLDESGETIIVNGRILRIDYNATTVTLTDVGPATNTNADVAVAISDSPDPVAAGGDITYVITVTNLGNVNATDVVVQGIVPENTTFVSDAFLSGHAPDSVTGPDAMGRISATYSTLGPGATSTFQVVVMVNSGTPGGTVITGTANVSATNDANDSNNSASTTTTVQTTADLAITKTIDPSTQTTAVPGGTITYTITVTNNGPGAVDGATVMDTFADAASTTITHTITGTVTGNISTDGNINDTLFMSSGAQIIYTVTETIAADATGALTNQATVTAPADVIDAPGNNISQETSVQLTPTADLSITKTDNVTTVGIGQTLTYIIDVHNAGPSAVTGATVADTFPANFTVTSVTSQVTAGTASGNTTSGTGNINDTVNMGPGATIEYTVTGTVGTGSPLANTATVTAPQGVIDAGGNNSATDTDTVSETQPTTDVSVTKTGPANVTAGNNLTYTITVQDTGTDASNVKLSDAIPAGTTYVNLLVPTGWSMPTVTNGVVSSSIGTLSSAAGPQVFTLIVTVNPSVADGSTIDNEADVSADADSNTGNNVGKAQTAVQALADISVTKIEDTDTVAPGGLLTYTILVHNAGPSDAQNVSLTDVQPDNTTLAEVDNPPGWMINTTNGIAAFIDTLPAGATATFTFKVQVDSTVASGTEITNDATVGTSTADDNKLNNRDSVTATVVAQGLPECDITTLNDIGDLGTAVIVDDADNPGNDALVITGTHSSDVIVVAPQPKHQGIMQVVRAGHVILTFISSDVSHIVIFGLEGNDKITISPLLLQPATIFGGSGNDVITAGSGDSQIDGGDGADKIVGGFGDDTICGGNGNDVLVGGFGNDTIFGDAGRDVINGGLGDDFILGGDDGDTIDGALGDDHIYGQGGNDTIVGGLGNNILVGGDGNDKIVAKPGRNIIIGGNGSDTLVGNAGDDILIAGSTAYDENDTALSAILDEWASGDSYDDRVNFIRNGGGANDPFVLDDTTVFDDGVRDTLVGDGGRDWFWVGANDKIKDHKANEQIN